MSFLSYHATDASCDVLGSFAVAVVLRRGCVGTRAVRRRALARGGRLGGGGRSTGRSCGVHGAVSWWWQGVSCKRARARAEGLEGGWSAGS